MARKAAVIITAREAEGLFVSISDLVAEAMVYAVVLSDFGAIRHFDQCAWARQDTRSLMNHPKKCNETIMMISIFHPSRLFKNSFQSYPAASLSNETIASFP